jgi:hypothetical protein
VKGAFRTVGDLTRGPKRAKPPENLESLAAGVFCEACRKAVFPEGEGDELTDQISEWLAEHASHGTVWEVVETEDGSIATIARLERAH